MTDAFKDIEKLEADLWEAADNLRANSKLTSSDYFMPVLGVVFLRHTANRFEAATRQIEDDGYPFKAGQLESDCRCSKMHGMPVTGGRGFRGLKPLWYNGVPP